MRPAPRCGSCGEHVAGRGRYCSGCGAAISDALHVKYAMYLDALNRLGVPCVLPAPASPSADDSAAAATATSPPPPPSNTAAHDAQYAGEERVFLRGVRSGGCPSPRPPSGSGGGGGGARRATAARRAARARDHPPPPFRPADGPQLDSAPLRSTRFATTRRVDGLSRPGRRRYKALGEVSWVDPASGRTVRVTSRAADGLEALRVTADKPRAASCVARLTLHAAPPAVSVHGATSEKLCFRLPPAGDPELGVVVAKLYAFASAHRVQHNIPTPPPFLDSTPAAGAPAAASPSEAGSGGGGGGGGGGWLAPLKRQAVPKEKLDSIVKRLHDDSAGHQKREAEELARKYGGGGGGGDDGTRRTGGVSLKDANERLYYQQMDLRRAQEERLSQAAAAPLDGRPPPAALHGEALQASTARLYTESVERQQARAAELERKYLSDGGGGGGGARSPSASEAALQRLYTKPLERQVERRRELYERHVAPTAHVPRKLTPGEMAGCVARLSKQEA